MKEKGGIRMTIRKERFGDVLDIKLEGRLDTLSSPLLENELEQSYNGLHELNFDFQGVDYISSAGLRVLLAALRRMNCQGCVTVSGASRQVMKVLEATGFTNMLTLC